MLRISNLLIAIFILSCTANCAMNESNTGSDSLIIDKKFHHRITTGFMVNRLLSDPNDLFRPNRVSMYFEYNLAYNTKWIYGLSYSRYKSIGVKFRNSVGVTEMKQTAVNNALQLHAEYSLLKGTDQIKYPHEVSAGLGLVVNGLQLQHEVESYQFTSGFRDKKFRDGYARQDYDLWKPGVLFRLKYCYHLEDQVFLSGVIDQKWTPKINIDGFDYYRELTEETIPITWQEYNLSGTYFTVVMGVKF